MSLERRITHLERQMDVDHGCVEWADVQAAQSRQQARARLAIGRRVDLDPGDPRVVDAMMWLNDDDPARGRQDEEMIARWRGQRGIRSDTGDVRQRFTERLDAIARRLQTR